MSDSKLLWPRYRDLAAWNMEECDNCCHLCEFMHHAISGNCMVGHSRMVQQQRLLRQVAPLSTREVIKIPSLDHQRHPNKQVSLFPIPQAASTAAHDMAICNIPVEGMPQTSRSAKRWH